MQSAYDLALGGTVVSASLVQTEKSLLESTKQYLEGWVRTEWFTYLQNVQTAQMERQQVEPNYDRYPITHDDRMSLRIARYNELRGHRNNRTGVDLTIAFFQEVVGREIAQHGLRVEKAARDDPGQAWLIRFRPVDQRYAGSR